VSSSAPLRECGPHFGFRIDAQSVGNAVDVIEIGNYFDGVKDIAVGQFKFAQRFKVLWPDGGVRACDEFGKLAQRVLARR